MRCGKERHDPDAVRHAQGRLRRRAQAAEEAVREGPEEGDRVGRLGQGYVRRNAVTGPFAHFGVQPLEGRQRPPRPRLDRLPAVGQDPPVLVFPFAFREDARFVHKLPEGFQGFPPGHRGLQSFRTLRVFDDLQM